MVLKNTLKNIKFSKNKTSKNKPKKIKQKGGSFGGPGYGVPPHINIDNAAIVYIHQMIGMYGPMFNLVTLMPNFVHQMMGIGCDPRIAEITYYRHITAMGYMSPMGPMGPPMGHPMGPPMGPPIGHPMGPPMGHPMGPPMGPMMSPMVTPTGPPMGAAMAPPPPKAAKRQCSDTVMLYEQLHTNTGCKEIMIELMTNMMQDYSFGGEIVSLMPGNNRIINELPSGYYFNWGIIDPTGVIDQKCHLTLHKTPSKTDVGTLHVRDDEIKSADDKTPQSIKINIDYDIKKRHFTISMNDKTNPPNPRLRKFAEDIMKVFRAYYNTCGNTVTIIL